MCVCVCVCVCACACVCICVCIYICVCMCVQLQSKYVTEVDASLDVKKKGQKKIGNSYFFSCMYGGIQSGP